MESAQSHMQLAETLAGSYTVYLPDRRGRGLSGAYGSSYSMQREVEDLDALLTKTGAQRIFGVSAGGLICLQAALTLPTIQKVAVYEPALIVNHSISTAFLPRYDREIAQGKIPAALVTGMLGAQMGPAFLQKMPRWLLEAFTRQGMKQEDKTARAGDVTMRSLAPTLHCLVRIDYDKREIVCSVGDLVYESTYRRIGVERQGRAVVGDRCRVGGEDGVHRFVDGRPVRYLAEAARGHDGGRRLPASGVLLEDLAALGARDRPVGDLPDQGGQLRRVHRDRRR
jgi:pimeloyl-ACP methyl ester carboxylesterase